MRKFLAGNAMKLIMNSNVSRGTSEWQNYIDIAPAIIVRFVVDLLCFVKNKSVRY